MDLRPPEPARHVPEGGLPHALEESVGPASQGAQAHLGTTFKYKSPTLKNRFPSVR
jgi:hypothetical protein